MTMASERALKLLTDCYNCHFVAIAVADAYLRESSGRR